MPTTLETLRAQEAQLLRELEAVRYAIARVETFDSTLPDDSDTVDSMDAMTIDTHKRRGGAQLDIDLPFSRVAKRLGLSLKELAGELKEDYVNVRNWNSRKRMPDDVRAKLDGLATRPAAKKRRGK